MEHPWKIVRVVAEAAKVLSAVIGIAALVLQFVPGVDVALDGLFLATALIALAGDSYLAASGHGSWGVAALDGLSVAMIGAGSLLGSAGEAAGSAETTTAETSTAFEDTTTAYRIEGPGNERLPSILNNETGAIGAAGDEQAAYEYATQMDKLDHIFAAKHGLDSLLRVFGSREAAIQEILNGLEGLTPATGVFEVPITVGGQNVVVRGAVLNGIVKLGTAFTPR